jgi:hypothetical protein
MDKPSIVMLSACIALMGGLAWKAKGTGTPKGPSAEITALANGVPGIEGQRTNDSSDDPPRPRREAPLALTASDGTGLTLTNLVARADVQDPLAFTELTLSFQNPQARQLEGTFRITLPPGASVSRFAMKVDGRWQEGEVVEKQAARVAYEDFLHRRQDPALLEQAGGNEFSARVFPIPPRGVKEIIISYSQELGAKSPYMLPLRGLPQLGAVDVEVNQEGARLPVQRFQQRNFVPDGDFILETKSEASNVGLRSSNMVLAKVRADIKGEAALDPVGGAVVLVDTSASRALGYEDQVDLTARLIRRLATSGAKGAFRVAAFDQVVVPIFSGTANEFGDKEIAALRARLPLGASNYARAFEWAGEEAQKAQIRRVILVSDGVATAGKYEGEAFATVLKKVKDAGVARVDAVAIGGIQDATMLKRIVSGTFARDGMVIDGALGVSNAARRLGSTTLANVSIDVPGATWFWPTKMEGVQAGDEMSVYADIPESRPFAVAVGGAPPASPELKRAVAPLLERAWVQAKIASLGELQSREPKPERVKQIIDLSVEHRVLSPYTALLVLETEQDYARFKIDRKALRDILTMESGALTLKHRSWPFDRAPVELADNKTKSASGARAKGEEGAMGNAAAAAPMAPPATPIAMPTSVAETTARPGGGPADPDQDRSSALVRQGAVPPPPAEQPAPAVAMREMEARPPPPSAAPSPASRRRAEPLADESAGLGLTGVGEGGGGRGEGIGLGGVGSGQGFGTGHGRIGGSHSGSAPTLRQGVLNVSGGLPQEVVSRIVRQNFGRFRLCYENGLRSNPSLEGRVTVRFQIGKDGAVSTTSDGGSDMPDANVIGCVQRAFGSMSFPAPEGGSAVMVTFPINFSPGSPSTGLDTNTANDWKANTLDPYTGKFKTVMSRVKAKDAAGALEAALAWHHDAPGDVLALVALGEAYETNNQPTEAARAYGSLIDYFSARADLRRFAGERLERIKTGEGLELASDTFEKAALQRPDHPASHRLLAFARLRAGDLPGAFDAALNGARRKYPEGRFLGVDRILREDLGLVGAAWIKKDPSVRAEVQRQLREVGARLETGPSLRFVLNWETDANDVDFHIMDSRGGHAYYSEMHLASGGDLYADVTTGYGPECFTIRLPKGQRAGPYKLQAHYYSRGPMGYGMGKLEIIDHDGSGGLTFEERPYVVMVDHAFLDLGTVKN